MPRAIPIILLALASLGCNEISRPEKFVVPAGYTGDVFILSGYGQGRNLT